LRKTLLFLAFLVPLLFLGAWVLAHTKTEQEVTLSTHVYKMDSVPLSLDIRLPNRYNPTLPGLIFIHGGGFSAGTRNAEPVQSFLDSMASRGVISASISYALTRKGRGFGCQVPVEEKREAVRHAGEDLIDALHWIQSQDNKWPSDWIAVGSSAGAEAALWSGYLSAPQAWSGIVSFSGALDGQAKVPQYAPPLFAIHGACDRVVPSGRSIHRQCRNDDVGAWELCGGLCWADSLRAAGFSATTWTECTGGHGVCNSAMMDKRVQDALFEWMTLLPEGKNECWSNTQGTLARNERTKCPQPCDSID